LVTVDATGARHKASNGVCTRIGNDHFAWFGTTEPKGRVNFLELLRAGHGDYVINAEALAYMRRRSLGSPAIRLLAEADDKQFADQAAWQAHPDQLGISALKVAPGSHAPGSHAAGSHAAGSHADCHGGRALGQRQGAWPAWLHSDRQRRCRPVQCRPTRIMLGPRRTACPQT